MSKLTDQQETDRLRHRILRSFRRFLRAEATGSLVLMGMTVVALWLANSRYAEAFTALWQHHVPVGVGAARLELTLAEWVNDGLMALFFLLVGLEIKRELLEGALASLRRAALPVVAALGGMAMPALLYLLCCALFGAGSVVRRGWAVPTATDIAFTVGVMTLLGKRVPLPVKVFVTALAIADDLGAVLVIALFYSAKVRWAWLAGMAGLMLLLVLLNRLGVRRLAIYLLLGAVLWGLTLRAGIHATLSGVLLGACVPLRQEKESDGPSPLLRLAHALEYPVALVVLPLFALANAGVSLPLHAAALSRPETAGVLFGLLFGKPLGIALASLLAVKLRIGELPANSSWPTLAGAAMLCGIGFTMSIFTAQLAFGAEAGLLDGAKLGILGGSISSALAGALFLRLVR